MSFLCKIEIIKYGLLYCDLLYTLRIGVFERFLSYDKNNENYGVNK